MGNTSFRSPHVEVDQIIKQDGYRASRFKVNDFDIYIRSNDKDLLSSNSKFKEVTAICKKLLLSCIGDIASKKSSSLPSVAHLISHNLTEANARNIQEISALLYKISMQKDQKGNAEITESLQNWVKDHPEMATKIIFNAYKNSQTIKTEIQIIELIGGAPSKLEVQSHSIHKFLMNLSYMLDKDVTLRIRETPASACFDYKSMHVAFFRIFENIDKYAKPGSHVEISVIQREERHLVKMEMISLAIDDDEVIDIFKQGIRGRHVNQTNGSGLGMWIAKDLMERNHAKINFNPDTSTRVVVDGTFFQKNTISISLPAR